jgi:MYXO-CTERM domain-containing protein
VRADHGGGPVKRFLLLPLLFGFHQPATFEASANDGGGNRMYFDGSPRQKSYDCSACHDDGTGSISVRIEGVTDSYAPGMAYTITVALVGEHAGFGTANNQNGFVAEFVDDSKQPVGALATPDVDKVELINDGFVVSGEGKGISMWTFTWTAPPAGRGAATLYLGMVDGNGANDIQVPKNDPSGDDVAVAKLRLCEGAPGCSGEPPKRELTESKAAGCNASARDAPGRTSLLLALVALVGLLHRRRRVLLALTLTGCFAAQGPEDCPNKVCGGTGGDAGTSCRENWVCTSWEAPIGSDQATRSCTDANNVGTSDCKPAASATLPALDLDYYKCRVQPIFQRGCGQMACHGTETERQFRIYSRGRWRNDELVAHRGSCGEAQGFKYNLQDDGSGTVMCAGWYPHTATEFKKNFDSARSFMLDVTDPADSLILREAAKGGLPHAQVKLFSSTDADYQTIKSWLGGAKLGTTCNTGAN